MSRRSWSLSWEHSLGTGKILPRGVESERYLELSRYEQRGGKWLIIQIWTGEKGNSMYVNWVVKSGEKRRASRATSENPLYETGDTGEISWRRELKTKSWSYHVRSIVHRQAAISGSNCVTVRLNRLALCKKVTELVHISFTNEIILRLLFLVDKLGFLK